MGWELWNSFEKWGEFLGYVSWRILCFYDFFKRLYSFKIIQGSIAELVTVWSEAKLPQLEYWLCYFTAVWDEQVNLCSSFYICKMEMKTRIIPRLRWELRECICMKHLKKTGYYTCRPNNLFDCLRSLAEGKTKQTQLFYLFLWPFLLNKWLFKLKNTLIKLMLSRWFTQW